ncbi:conserved hypothetical protein [uncultured delta proteobacterium]|uniref:Uncharacterized protein n=1 Tax=uncultured delta proteobacterium TaxID=34034 RepID=A0A212JYL3_9DELT|nr:conserved hypothetical protein [uncultured delta proteobacterium]
MQNEQDLLKKPCCCKCREKTIEFIEKRMPEAPAKKMLLDAMQENKSLLGSIIQVLNGMTFGLLLLWFAVLGFLLFLNIFIHPHHPHFGVDAYWGFWAVFGLGVGVIMVYVMKRIIQPLIVRKEDYYGDI